MRRPATRFSTVSLSRILGVLVIAATVGFAVRQLDAQCESKLLAPDGAPDDLFGHAVALSDAIAIVGAYLDDDNGDGSGSAYVFDTITGQPLFKLLPDDGSAGNEFGYSVAVNGTLAIVGAHYDNDNGSDSGSAYLFDAFTGQQLFKLTPSDGATRDEFGCAVAIVDTTAIVGAHYDDDNGFDSGSAYLFDTTTGQQLFKLTPDDGAADDDFGRSVAISGNVAIVGAALDDDNGTDSGSVYVFDTTTGQQLFKLLPSDGRDGDVFGVSVSISGMTAIVGAQRDSHNGINAGSTYIFDLNTGEQLLKIMPRDGAARDRFGSSVAISGSTVLSGAAGNDDNGSDSGSAYLFHLDCGPRLDIVTSCPSGGPFEALWTRATAGRTIALVFARDTGSYRIPNGNPCAGTVMGLGSNQIRVVWRGNSGPDGEGSLTSSASAAVCGGHLQILDLASCATSNVVTIE